MSWQWTNPPPLTVLSGAQEFLRLRELKKAVGAADKKGRDVHYLEGAEREALNGILSSSGFLFKQTLGLVVLENPDKADLEVLGGHQERGDNTTSLVLHYQGKLKATSVFGKWVKKLPSEVVAEVGVPKPWEADEHAAQFLVREAKSRKLKLDHRLAMGIVQNAGTEYGILSFELDKIARLISARGDGSEITSEHVKSVIARFSELGAMPISQALGKKSLKGVSRALTNMRRTHAGHAAGATLKVCALLSHSASTWLHAASLLAQGASVEEISERMKIHAYVVRKNILPVAKLWSESSLVELLNSISAIERGVKSGHAHPWAQLECMIFRAVSQ